MGGAEDRGITLLPTLLSTLTRPPPHNHPNPALRPQRQRLRLDRLSRHQRKRHARDQRGEDQVRRQPSDGRPAAVSRARRKPQWDLFCRQATGALCNNHPRVVVVVNAYFTTTVAADQCPMYQSGSMARAWRYRAASYWSGAARHNAPRRALCAPDVLSTQHGSRAIAVRWSPRPPQRSLPPPHDHLHPALRPQPGAR